MIESKNSKLPIVDIIIPLYRVGSVFIDTIFSVLKQNKEHHISRCTIVSDGCEQIHTTQDILDDLSISQYFDIDIIYKVNAGVVNARNEGILHILDKDERSKFVLFLDGDDILAPNYIDESVLTLSKSQNCMDGTELVEKPGWVYCDQFHFGDHVHWMQYPTKMWGARFALNNFSQPSCLMDMRLLSEEGILFDTLFKLGIEDWDFWCSAVDAGFIGVHSDKTYVNYRRLTGSRSTYNRQNDGLTKFCLNKKHSLTNYNRIVTHEDVFPRLGVLADTDNCRRIGKLFSIPKSELIKVECDRDLVLAMRRISVRSRYRYAKNGVLDNPYTPDLMILRAPEKIQIQDSIILFIENYLYHKPEISLVEFIDCDGGVYLFAVLSRIYNDLGEIRSEIAISVINQKCISELNVTNSSFPQNDSIISECSSKKISDILRLSPKIIRNNNNIFEKRVLGENRSTHYVFYKDSIGYIPIRLSEISNGDKNDTYMGYIIPASGIGVDRNILENIFQENRKCKNILYIVIHEKGEVYDNAIASSYEWDHIIFIWNNFIEFSYGKKPNRSYFGHALNEPDLDEFDSNFISYFAGALAVCDIHHCFGVFRAASALIMLKSTKNTHNVYIQHSDNCDSDEFLHLNAYSGLYSKFLYRSESWRIEAMARGVKNLN